MLRTLKKIIFFLPFILLFALVFGYFFYFKPTINQTYLLPSQFDGIAVLTGGKGRIEKALEIHKKFPSSKLLISGVHKKVTLNNIINSTKYNKESIFIDNVSESTLQNAIEIVSWSREKNIKEIVIITSYYHMPRSMVLLNYFGEEIKYYPIPVKVKDTKNNSWNNNVFLFEEYIKFLLSSSLKMIAS